MIIYHVLARRCFHNLFKFHVLYLLVINMLNNNSANLLLSRPTKKIILHTVKTTITDIVIITLLHQIDIQLNCCFVLFSGCHSVIHT